MAEKVTVDRYIGKREHARAIGAPSELGVPALKPGDKVSSKVAKALGVTGGKKKARR